MSQAIITGSVKAGFEPVKEAFAANFNEGKELGAGFTALRNGEVLVDLHGGFADRDKQIPWSAKTTVPVYSTTKPIAALVLAHLLEPLPNGYDTPVAEIWPDFSAKGKARVTLGQMVSHQAGLPGFVDPIDPGLWLDPPACAKALANQAPLWSPGHAHGYHPLSWGYLIGEVVQRIAGRSLGSVLAEAFCDPEGIDFTIGTPQAEHSRVAEIMRPRALPDLGEINDATRAAFLTKWAAPDRGGAIWREIEIPSANGIGTSRAVAELYSVYANRGWLGERRVISEQAYSALVQSRTLGQDLVLPFITEFGAGVMRNNLGMYGPNPDTLCHSGWGGSLALGDPDRGLSAAYVMNRQSNSLQGDPRARRLVDTLYACL
ncbi:MAG: serine hydrolase domain-containing protein [Pseudomonadota bacterium]